MDLARLVSNDNTILSNPTVLGEQLRLELVKRLLFQCSFMKAQGLQYIFTRDCQKRVILQQKFMHQLYNSQ